MQSCDTIVIGGGINGLAAAGRLARAGQKVLVVEGRTKLGGGADTHEFAAGFHVSRVAHLLNMLDSRVIRGLELQKHGFHYAAENVPTTALSINGDHLLLDGAFAESIEGSLPVHDRESWKQLRQRLMRFSRLLAPFRQMTPPRLGQNARLDNLKLIAAGLKLRSMGRIKTQELMRLLLINISDVLEDELTDDRLKGLIAHDTVLGAHLGPRSPNSLLLLLNRLAGDVNGKQASLALPSGGMGAVVDAMRKSLTNAQVAFREGTPVARIEISDGTAKGVTLQNGETISADRIVSAINPKTTLLSLVGPQHFDTGMVRRISSIRMRGSTAKLHLALKALPDFRGADLRSRLVVAPSVQAVEEAFNSIKYGKVSDVPMMEIVIPTVFENQGAPPGHHVLSAIIQFVPTHIEGGWHKAGPQLQKRCLAQLEAYAPGISRLIVASELLTPADLEASYGFVGGNWHHGELAVEQMLFLRPAPGLAQYETPIANLYLAGAGCHPGGGISGTAGWNAAEHILRRRSR